MTDRRAEIDLELEWLDARDAFVAAKATRDTDPEGYATKKARMSEMRTFWRGIGEYLGLRSGVGGINVSQGQPAPIEATPEEG